MACPRTAQRTEAYGPSVSLQWQAVGSTRSSSRTGNAFLPLQSASHLRPCDACGYAHAVSGRALGKEGIMHATLSPSWKKSLLLVFVSVVAFATATPATSGPQCFFQGLGFLPGRNQSDAHGVNADGTVVVGSSNGQAFRWTAASGMVGLGALPPTLSVARGVNADGTVVVGGIAFPP